MAHPQTSRVMLRSALNRFGRRSWLAMLTVVALLLTAVGGAIFATGSTTVIIEQVTPGNIPEGVGTAEFRVRLSDPIADGSITVTVSTVDGTGPNGATSGAGPGDGDFDANTEVFVFTPAAPGPFIFGVTINDDTIDELNETFTIALNVSAITSASVFTGTPLTAVIEDNDSPALVSITGPGTVSEGAGSVTFGVTMDNTSPQPSTFSWQLVTTGPGIVNPITLPPPLAGADVTAASGIWTIPANTPAGTTNFSIGIINDTLPEPNEQFRLTITAVTNVSNTAAALATSELVTILDDDGAPNVTTNTGLTVLEGGSGTIAQANLEATDSQQGPAQVTFTVSTLPVNGTLFRNSVAVALNGTFTQQDINNNLLSYTHNGSETTSDSFVFSVSDGFNSNGPVTFTITVTPVNDPPVFNPDTYNVDVPENAAGGAAVVTVTATDPDIGDTLTYSITAGNTGNAFTINPSTGAITVTDPSVLDFETTPSYTLTVTVTDAGGLTDTATVNITILDAPDAPVFNPDTYNEDVPEDAAGGAAVVTVTATDPDAGDTLTYSITAGNTGGAFTINAATGAITVSNPSVLNFETTPSYTLTVTVTDAGGLTDTATVNITILDAPDAPVFNPDTYNEDVPEDAAGGAAVVTVTATDPDAGDTLTYSITAGNTGGAFTINAATGAITVSNPSVLNFETTPSYTLTVTVTDSTSRTDTATVNITITNVNEPPVFNPDTYTETIPEDTPAGAVVVQLNVDDPDVGDTFTYAITTGNVGNAFTVNSSGQIVVATPSVLDFETTPSYTLTVTVTDAGGLSDTATVTITILDANDPPVFNPDTYAEDVSEDAAGGTAVVTVTATDPDAGDTLTYSITGGNTGNAFTINAATGAITVSNPSVLDFETTPSYTLTVTVTDAGGLTDTATVNITILDAPDAPVFNPDTYNVDVPENAAGGAAVVTVLATDPDAGDTLTYSITAGNTANAFTIDPDTGEITVTDPSVLDFETLASYTLTVTVTDSTSRTDTATVNITITNVNEPPVFNPDTYTEDVSEDAAGGAAVVTVTATDPDAGDTLTYSITAGNTGGAFTINAATGAITVSNPSVLNFETTPSYTLTVTVTDAGGLTDTATVNITILDAPDAPVFNPDTYNVDVPEDTAGGAAVVTVLATDDDAGDTLTYSITAGNTGGAFTINAATGAITVSNPSVLNFETTPSYTLTVTVTDSTSRTDTATVNITITNVNEPPVFNPDTYTETIPEDTPAGAVVVQLNVDDPDVGDTFTYAITTGNVGNAFTVNSSGQIVVATPSVLDFETTPSYTLTVTVTDAGGLSDTATVTITITNVNEPPVATDDTYTTPEETTLTVGSADGVLANDTDPESPLALEVTNVIIDGTTFAVETTVTTAEGGELFMRANGSFDYTPAVDFVGDDVFTYTVSDPDGLTDTATVTITVTNVNDDPEITTNDGLTVDEGAEATITTAMLEVTDVDNTPSEITFILLGGPLRGELRLNGTPLSVTNTFTQADINNGNLSYRHDGSESPLSDSFQFEAFDLDDASTGLGTFLITITPVNDPPVVDANGVAAGINFTVPTAYAEGQATPLLIVDPALTVTDADSTTLQTVQVVIDDLLNGADEALAVDTGSTGIVPSYASGVLTLTGPADLADFEAVLRTLTYSNSSVNPGTGRTISIVATDTGTLPASSDPATLITLTITPEFSEPTLENTGLTVDEGATETITTANLSASDIDTADADLVFTVTGVPANGTLLLSGTALGQNQTFTQADIAAGRLSYQHNGSETTSDSFTFSLTDGDTTPTNGTFNITVNPVNDAPVIVTTSGTTTYLVGSAAVLVDPGALVSDVDSANFDTGELVVALTPANSGDTLAIRNQGTSAGQIGVTGSNVTFGGVTIGTFTGGDNGVDLIVTLNANATPAAAQALVRNITFVNTLELPVVGTRTVTFTISDGDGATSAPATKQVEVTTTPPVNQLPIAQDDALTIPVNAPPQTIDVLANDSDPDNDPLTITSVTQGSNGGTVTISGDATTVIYTVAPDFAGAEFFTYTISDGRGGVSSATVRITVTDDPQPTTFQLFLPLVTTAPEPEPLPDLVVSFVVDPVSPQAGADAAITVTVTNQGDAPASNFWIDFYINPSREPGVNDPWNEVCSLDPCFGIAWFYTGTIAPGESLNFVSRPFRPLTLRGYVEASTNWPGYFANGTTKLYAVVDSWNRDETGGIRDPNGAVIESDETNNRAEADIVVTPGVLPAAASTFPSPASLPSRPPLR